MNLAQLYLERERIESACQRHLSALEALNVERQTNLRAINAALLHNKTAMPRSMFAAPALEAFEVGDFPELGLDKP